MNSLRLLSIALLACAAPALAQDYPSKPVRFLVTLPAGSSGDIVAAIAAKAPPDGYTLFISTISTHGTNPWLYSQPGFDPVKDFVPVVLLASNPNVLVVLPSTPVRSVKELIALAKARPGEVTLPRL